MIHKINILIHVIAGTVALAIGILTIVLNRKPLLHKKYGRYFTYLLSAVIVTGFIGWLFFRSSPFLLTLTLLAGYTGLTGFRTVRLREKKTSWIDAIIAASVLITGIIYWLWLSRNSDQWSPAVIMPTLSALGLVTIYDLLKFFWIHTYIKSWWLYEHIYKMFSAFSGLLSAFTGTVLPNFKPYSQIGPSIVCTLVIVFFIWQRARLRKLKL